SRGGRSDGSHAEGRGRGGGARREAGRVGGRGEAKDGIVANERIEAMSVIKSGNKNHDDTCNASEAARQVAVAAASTQAAVNAAEITHHRNCLASAKANGCGIEPFVTALRSLGTGGA